MKQTWGYQENLAFWDPWRFSDERTGKPGKSNTRDIHRRWPSVDEAGRCYVWNAGWNTIILPSSGLTTCPAGATALCKNTHRLTDGWYCVSRRDRSNHSGALDSFYFYVPKANEIEWHSLCLVVLLNLKVVINKKKVKMVWQGGAHSFMLISK